MSDIGKKYQSTDQIAEPAASNDLLGHNTLPSGKRIVKKTVTNPNTGREIVVEIEVLDNDVEGARSNLDEAAISSTGVVRITQDFRDDRSRRILENGDDIDPDIDPALRDFNTQVRLSNSASCSPRTERGSRCPGRSTKHGIFKNPVYNYEGGLMDKLIALLGNIVKFIEQIILRLMGARDDTLDPILHGNPKAARPSNEDSHSASAKEVNSKDQRKRRRS
jgi:hypothetical protein